MKVCVFNEDWMVYLLKCFDVFVVYKCWYVDCLYFIDFVVDWDNCDVDFGYNFFYFFDFEGVFRKEFDGVY